MRTVLKRSAMLLALLMSCFASGSANAAAEGALRIGIPRPLVSADPHWTIDGATIQVLSQIFEPLVRRNRDSLNEPGLAESWSSPDGVNWTFKLRGNAKFHDGSPVTIEDVVFSINRAGESKGPVSPRSVVEQIKEIRAADATTLVLVTKDPLPHFLDGLSYVLVLPKKAAEKLSAEDFNAGRGMIGSGPYKLVSWSLNDAVVLTANPDYWDAAPVWKDVTFKVLPNDASRVAALLAGDIDVIEQVPVQNLEQLRKDSNIALWDRATAQVAHISMDVGPEGLASGKITGPNGEKLDRNPLADARVREALKIAIDLGLFTDRVYLGAAIATGQFLLPDMPGYIPDVKPWAANVERAKKLLEEAGWAGKFKVQLAASQTVFQYSPRVAEGIAQSWARIGVPTTVSALAHQVFVNNNVAREWPIYLMAFSNVQGTAASVFQLLLHTRSAGYGSLNWARYSNATLDKLSEEGMRTMDEGKRNALYQDAFKAAYADNAVLPLWLFVNTAATRKDLKLNPRMDRVVHPADVTRR